MAVVPLAARGDFLAKLLTGLTGLNEKNAAADNAGYKKNYGVIQQVGLSNTVDVARAKANEIKNRYRNVLAYDHTRLVLDDTSGGSDYINANWIPGFNNPKRYIATQGPVPPTIVDFWRMVWQVQAECIIKVTREVEGGTLKCHRYWPDPTSEPPQKVVLLGSVEVEFLGTVESEIFVTRRFKLKKDGKELLVTQFSYEAWPDHGVPLTTNQFLDFRRNVKTVTDKTKSPIVIHCSAGVGRTGTYITVDRVLDAVEAGVKSKDLDIDSSVRQARQHRVFMVQTIQQYMFCFQALLSGIRDELRRLTVDTVDKGHPQAAKAPALTLSRPQKEYVEKDLALAAKKDEEEAAEIAKLQTPAPKKAGGGAAKGRTFKVGPPPPMPMAIPSPGDASWKKAEDDEYDTSKMLSSIESRVTSILQMGGEVDLTPATPDQIRHIVESAKALSLRKREEALAKIQTMKAREERVAEAQTQNAKMASKLEKKRTSESAANKFLAKMKGGTP